MNILLILYLLLTPSPNRLEFCHTLTRVTYTIVLADKPDTYNNLPLPEGEICIDNPPIPIKITYYLNDCDRHWTYTMWPHHPEIFCWDHNPNDWIEITVIPISQG